MKKVSEYEQSAIDFLKKTKTTFSAKFVKKDLYYPDDKEKRNIYKITLKNDKHTFHFNFGQSIMSSKDNTPPTAYDVLAGITDNDPGTFKNFCDEFGYNTDSKKDEKVYNAVVKEWQNVKLLFTAKQIEQLQEIQ